MKSSPDSWNVHAVEYHKKYKPIRHIGNNYPYLESETSIIKKNT